jgi:hypothetical protein
MCSLQRLQSPRSSRTIGKVSPAILLMASNSGGKVEAAGVAGCFADVGIGADLGLAFGKMDSSMTAKALSGAAEIPAREFSPEVDPLRSL